MRDRTAAPAGRSVFITGCSSGIGLAVARGLAQRGYAVIASARKPADVDRLQEEGLSAIALDLDDSASIREAVDEVLKRTEGRLYGLFNNGAYGQPGAVEDLSREMLRAQFETNLFGTQELTNALIPAMRAQGGGRIIYNSSILGFAAFPYRGAYNASKFALEGLADTLRLELRGTGIEVSLIEPGPIESRFRDNAYAVYQRTLKGKPSVHAENYAAMEARLQKEGPAAPFTLPPEAVLRKVVHALEAKAPQARYRVTLPTHVFATLRRLLPAKILDALLLKASGDGKR
ncbi:MAG: SDR family NAD(P)-dependent oxidoreductase [Thiotrichales bacterium]